MFTEGERRPINIAAPIAHHPRSAIWSAIKKNSTGLLYGSALTLSLIGQDALAHQEYGEDVNSRCSAQGGNPATPFDLNNLKGDNGCYLCHGNGLFGGAGPGKTAYQQNDLDFFCETDPNAINTPPELDPIGNKIAETGVPLTFDVTASDPDGNEITLTASGLPTGATFEENENGGSTFSWIPTPDQTATQTVTFTATDNGTPPESDSEEISISIGGANQAPVLDPIGPQSATVGQQLQFVISATDADNNNLAFTDGNLPTGADLQDNENGTATFTWTPAAAQVGNHTVNFTVTDDGDPPESDAEDVTITVAQAGSGGNTAPVLAPIGNKTVEETQQLSFTITASDQDGDTVRFSANNLPGNANLVDNLNGSAQFIWTPARADVGDHTITIIATDNGNPPANDTENIVVTVTEAGAAGNRPPILNTIGNQQVYTGETLNLTITGNDPDGDQLAFTAQNVPPTASFSAPGGTATFSWTPTASDLGNHAVTIILTDNGTPAKSVNETFNIAVDDANNRVNRPPVLEGVGGQSVTAGSSMSLRMITRDPDGDDLHYLVIGKPANSRIVTNGNGIADFTWTPRPEDVGLHMFLVLVADSGSPMELDGEIVLLNVSQDNGLTQFQVHDAAIVQSSQNGDRLRVRGSVISSDSVLFNSYYGERVEITDADSGESLGFGRVNYNGSWTVETQQLFTYPCKVVAHIGSKKEEIDVAEANCKE